MRMSTRGERADQTPLGADLTARGLEPRMVPGFDSHGRARAFAFCHAPATRPPAVARARPEGLRRIRLSDSLAAGGGARCARRAGLRLFLRPAARRAA